MDSRKLIGWARQHLERILNDQPGLDPNTLMDQEPTLREPGACFITLTDQGQLRGCIGSLVPHSPLAEDLLDNALSAARHDTRFQPVDRTELPRLRIEISLLSPPQPFPHDTPEALLKGLVPNQHGVILTLEGRRATFLPQVWEQLPDPRTFLEHLCLKAGLSGDCWRQNPKIEIYTVQKFRETNPS